MVATCSVLSTDGEFLRNTLLAVDCYAQNIGEAGYQALASPGSPISFVLTSLLTIFVALFGYRMMFGQVPTSRDGVLAVVKIGIVLALATSWLTFRTLAYDVAMRAPAELAAAIGQPAGLPASEGGLVNRLQGVDTMLSDLAIIGTGKPPEAEKVVGSNGVEGTVAQQQQFLDLQQRPRWSAERDGKLVTQARIVFLFAAIGAFASVRLVAGILLALGPLFALFLLFDGTRGLFVGWLRVLAGTALGALATSLVLTVELALIEPWLAAIITERRLNVPTPRVPVELLVVTLTFAVSLLAVLIGTARVTLGFDLPIGFREVSSKWVDALRRSEQSAAMTVGDQRSNTPADERSRAISLAAAVTSAQRREAYSPAGDRVPSLGQYIGTTNSRGAETVATAQSAKNAASRRRTRGRISAGSARRDVKG